MKREPSTLLEEFHANFSAWKSLSTLKPANPEWLSRDIKNLYEQMLHARHLFTIRNVGEHADADFEGLFKNVEREYKEFGHAVLEAMQSSPLKKATRKDSPSPAHFRQVTIGGTTLWINLDRKFA